MTAHTFFIYQFSVSLVRCHPEGACEGSISLRHAEFACPERSRRISVSLVHWDPETKACRHGMRVQDDRTL